MLIDFLRTSRDKTDLKIALDVIQEFKGCEDNIELITVPTYTWAKLEQLECFLGYLLDDPRLDDDTKQKLRNALIVQ